MDIMDGIMDTSNMEKDTKPVNSMTTPCLVVNGNSVVSLTVYFLSSTTSQRALPKMVFDFDFKMNNQNNMLVNKFWRIIAFRFLR